MVDVPVLHRYVEVRAALIDETRFSSRFGNDVRHRDVDALVCLEGLEHRALRRKLAPPFAPESISRLDGALASEIEAAVERLVQDCRVDGVADFAAPLANDLLAHALAVPSRSVRSLLHQPPAVRRALVDQVLQARPHAGGSSGGVVTHLRDLIATGAITTGQASSFVHLLLSAGIDTVRDTLSEVLLLATDAEVWSDVRHSDAPPEAIAEEILRWSTPLHSVFRTTTDADSIDGHPLAPDSKVRLGLRAANRDRATFHDPGSFSAHRFARADAAPHLAFGAGPHRCPGAHLVRRELVHVVRSLRDALASAALDGPLRRNQGVSSRPLRTLPLRITPT